MFFSFFGLLEWEGGEGGGQKVAQNEEQLHPSHAISQEQYNL